MKHTYTDKTTTVAWGYNNRTNKEKTGLEKKKQGFRTKQKQQQKHRL